MEEKIYEILRKHKLPLKKREDVIVDLLKLPPNLSMKCNDKWEPLKEPEKYHFFLKGITNGETVEWIRKCQEYKDARSYRERIEELEKEIESKQVDLNESIETVNEWAEELDEKHKENKLLKNTAAKDLLTVLEKDLKIEQLTKERDELKVKLMGQSSTMLELKEQLQAEKNKVEKLIEFCDKYIEHTRVQDELERLLKS